MPDEFDRIGELCARQSVAPNYPAEKPLSEMTQYETHAIRDIGNLVASALRSQHTADCDRLENALHQEHAKARREMGEECERIAALEETDLMCMDDIGMTGSSEIARQIKLKIRALIDKESK